MQSVSSLVLLKSTDINRNAIEFAVANVKDIEWNKNAFRHLELAEDQKRVLEALVELQLGPEYNASYDNLITGKEQGNHPSLAVRSRWHTGAA